MLKYEGSFKIGESDLDERGNIKASSLMYQFQEIAAAHAEELGIGFEALMKDNRIWVMSKLRFKKYAGFTAEDEYIIETYPRPKKGVTYFRDYYVYDMNHELMAAGTGHWCIINFVTRKIERTNIDFHGDYIDKPVFEEGVGKIKVGEMTLTGSHEVIESDLDKNQHTNNCRYADMVEEVVTNKEYSDFTINFSKEALLGDVISIFIEKKEHSTVVAGKLEGDKLVFQAEIF